MKKKIFLMLSLIAIMVVMLAISVSAATYYCDKDGNLVEAGSNNIAYEFDVGGDRTNDENKCFRITDVYLHDTSLTKIVFPVASQVKSGYDGIAPQSYWKTSLGVYAVDENGERSTEVSYAAQITEIEFLSGVDFDGAYGYGTFSGFTGLKKLIFNGNISMAGDAAKKGGMFNNAPITDVVIRGSGTVNLVFIRHINTSNDLTVTFDKDCTARVYVLRDTYYCLPSASISNWTIIFNPKITYGVLGASGVTVTPLCETGTPTTKIIMGVDNVNAVTDEATAHNLLYSYEDQTVITAELKAWCELGQDEHDNIIQLSYDNGFENVGKKSDSCLKCCNISTTEEAPALFTCLGYSTPENGTCGIAIGFSVDNEAIKDYEAITGTTVKYGVFAVLKDKLGDNDVFAKDGALAEGAIAVEISSHKLSAFELKIVGFADDQKDIELAIGAYVEAVATDGETATSEYSYMQGVELTENESYHFVSYNYISGLETSAE